MTGLAKYKYFIFIYLENLYNIIFLVKNAVFSKAYSKDINYFI